MRVELEGGRRWEFKLNSGEYKINISNEKN